MTLWNEAIQCFLRACIRFTYRHLRGKNYGPSAFRRAFGLVALYKDVLTCPVAEIYVGREA